MQRLWDLEATRFLKYGSMHEIQTTICCQEVCRLLSFKSLKECGAVRQPINQYTFMARTEAAAQKHRI